MTPENIKLSCFVLFCSSHSSVIAALERETFVIGSLSQALNIMIGSTPHVKWCVMV